MSMQRKAKQFVLKNECPFPLTNDATLYKFTSSNFMAQKIRCVRMSVAEASGSLDVLLREDRVLALDIKYY